MPIPSESMGEVVKNLLDFLEDSVKVLEAMYQEIDFEDRDREDARNEFEEEAGEEKNCVENLLDALGYIIRFAGSSIAPLYQQYIAPFCSKYMASQFEFIMFVGVCSMDDMMLYASEVVSGVMSDVLSFFFNHIRCEDPSLRQAVLFGVKVAVEHYPALITSQAQSILTTLLQVVQGEEAREDDYTSATDNGISAIFSILLGYRSSLSPQVFSQAINFVVQQLPLQDDVAEAQDVHERVVAELMKPNHGVFDNKSVLDKVIRTLPLMLLPTYDDGDNEYQITYDETKVVILNMLKTLDPRQMNSLLSGLEPDVLMAVKMILNN